jgi:hypothetical protein
MYGAISHILHAMGLHMDSGRDSNLDTCGVREEVAVKGARDGNRHTYCV